jgi:hypothetical protein
MRHTTGVTPQWTTRRLAFLVAGAAIVVIAALLYLNSGSNYRDAAVASGNLPSRLSDSEFWKMVTDFSEPGGTFRYDNFLSNEIGFQEVIPDLRKTVKPGGAYLGVGPEQNFTYIAALRPRMAFIIDIRRQNMIEHLLYKAFINIASDRAEFISLLFARPRPENLDRESTANALFLAFHDSNPNSDLFERNLFIALEHLKEHGISLSFGDQASMRKVYNAFFEAGPDLSYTFSGNVPSPGRGMPSYSELMTATDGWGKNWGYLATEAHFETIQDLERNNLIIPLVGDFAGDKTIRTVGQYVKEHRAIVTTFYLSNVEQYLFQQDDDWSRFYGNTATLPTDPTSMFIRSTAGSPGMFSGLGGRRGSLKMLTSPVEDLVRAFKADEIHSYSDVLRGPNSKD